MKCFNFARMRSRGRFPTLVLARGLRLCNPFALSFQHDLAFKLCNPTKNGQDEFSSRRSCIHAQPKNAKVRRSARERLQYLHQMAYRARQTVKAGYHKGVAVPHVFKRVSEFLGGAMTLYLIAADAA